MSDAQTAAYAAVAAAMPAQSEDSLQRARKLVDELRGYELEMASLNERVAALAASVHEIRTKKLVELMSALGIKNLTIEADGNSPAYEAMLKPYYKASIPSDWPPEKQQAAFDALEKMGDGDLIKHTFTIALDRDSTEDAEAVREAMKVLGIEYEEKKAVHHATLTAWLKEQIGQKKRQGIPLDVLGASVGQQVDVKPVKLKL